MRIDTMIYTNKHSIVMAMIEKRISSNEYTISDKIGRAHV